MTSMTEKELAALESAKRTPIQFDDVRIDHVHTILRDAQTLRAQFLAQQAGRLWGQMRSALGLDRRAEQTAARRLYKQTVRELSKLDQRELADLGIGQGQIHLVARRAVGLPESEEAGLLTRLRRRMADARDRRHTARQLATLDSRMLHDIGINHGDIHAYLRGEKDLGNQHPAMQLAAPTVAVDLLFPQPVQVQGGQVQGSQIQPAQVGWTGTPEAANHGEEEARAA